MNDETQQTADLMNLIRATDEGDADAMVQALSSIRQRRGIAHALIDAVRLVNELGNYQHGQRWHDVLATTVTVAEVDELDS